MQNEPIETVTSEAHFEKGIFVERQTLKIFRDEDPQNPRTEFDNFGHMICFHRRDALGDAEDSNEIGDFTGWDGLENLLIREKKAIIVIPLYMYDHSGITVQTHPFADQWDSGQIGFIYCTREDIRKNWKVKVVKKELRDHARKLMEGEVKEYDDYLTGNVYGYTLEDERGNVFCSCWGYSGNDAATRIKSDLHMDSVHQPAGTGEPVEA